MFTALYDFRDEYGQRTQANAKIGGYKSLTSAISAVLRRSPYKSGTIAVGQAIRAIVHNGQVIDFSSQ